MTARLEFILFTAFLILIMATPANQTSQTSDACRPVDIWCSIRDQAIETINANQSACDALYQRLVVPAKAALARARLELTTLSTNNKHAINSNQRRIDRAQRAHLFQRLMQPRPMPLMVLAQCYALSDAERTLLKQHGCEVKETSFSIQARATGETPRRLSEYRGEWEVRNESTAKFVHPIDGSWSAFPLLRTTVPPSSELEWDSQSAETCTWYPERTLPGSEFSSTKIAQSFQYAVLGLGGTAQHYLDETNGTHTIVMFDDDEAIVEFETSLVAVWYPQVTVPMIKSTADERYTAFSTALLAWVSEDQAEKD